MPDCEFHRPNPQTCSFLLELLNKFPISLDEVSQLLELGCCDTNQNNASGMTPIKAAIMNGSVQIVQAIYQASGIVLSEHLEFARRSYPHKGEVVAYLTSIVEIGALEQITSQRNKARCSRSL